MSEFITLYLGHFSMCLYTMESAQNLTSLMLNDTFHSYVIECYSHVHVHLGALILRCSTPFNLMYIICYDIVVITIVITL